MKLKYLFALPILALALAGCDEIEYSDAKPVENPQLPGITQDDFSVTPASSLGGLMNLEALSSQTDNPDEYMIELYTINVLTENLPESAVVTGGLQLSTTEDFANPFNIDNVSVADGVASAPLSSFTYIRSQMFGKDPREYTVYYRIPVYVTLNGGEYKIGDKNYYFCDGDDFQQEGVDPGYVVEEAYYLLGPAGTNLSSAVKFNHSGYNVYDDTNFNLVAEFTEGNTTWIIVPESAYKAANGGTPDASKLYGPTTAVALTGVLNLGGQAGTVDPGKYKFNINMSTLEYTISPVTYPAYVSTPGSVNGWAWDESNWLAYTESKGANLGAAVLKDEFKFCTDKGTWYGISGDLVTDNGTISGSLSDADAPNIPVGHGLYWIVYRSDEETFTMTEVTSLGVIGDFNGWGGQTNLTPSEDFYTWTGELSIPADADGWKIRINDNWDMNYGGSFTDMVVDGENFHYSGTFKITVDFHGNYPVITVE